MPTLADILRAELAARKWTVYRLATESQIPTSTLYQLTTGEVNNPMLTTLDRILATMGHDYHWLHDKGYRPHSN